MDPTIQQHDHDNDKKSGVGDSGLYYLSVRVGLFPFQLATVVATGSSSLGLTLHIIYFLTFSANLNNPRTHVHALPCSRDLNSESRACLLVLRRSCLLLWRIPYRPVAYGLRCKSLERNLVRTPLMMNSVGGGEGRGEVVRRRLGRLCR